MRLIVGRVRPVVHAGQHVRGTLSLLTLWHGFWDDRSAIALKVVLILALLVAMAWGGN